MGDAVLLPLGFGVADLEADNFPVSNLSGGGFPGCDDDDVDEESVALAVTSIDGGRDRPKGIENVFARAANDGKGDDDVIAVADGTEAAVSGDGVSGGVGGEMWRSFDGGRGGGVSGGGGWPSEVSHASRAAFSSWLTRGSNWLRTSLEFESSFFGSGVVSRAWSSLRPAKIG
jgi:hypothetical protein